MERELYYIIKVTSVESPVTGKPYHHTEIAFDMEDSRFREGTVWNATTGTWEKFDENPDVEGLSARHYAYLLSMFGEANELASQTWFSGVTFRCAGPQENQTEE